MQRSAVNRIGDLVKTVLWTSLFVYNLAWCAQLGYFGFFTSKPVWIGDQLLSLVLVVWAGWFGFVEWHTLFRYHTLAWFFRNLGVYIPFLFWRGLTVVVMGVMHRWMVFASWVVSKSYPGRGMVFSLDFEDERDFKQTLRTARDEGLSVTASVDGRPVYDADLLESSLTYPPIAKLHVVDAVPPMRRDDWHDDLL